MNEQMLKLCRRLKTFTLEEVSAIAETSKSEMASILKCLVRENRLEQQGKRFIYLQNQTQTQKRLPIFFQCPSKETICIMIKAFSCEIEEYKTEFLTDKSHAIILKFNKYFRKIIFENQKEELLKHYENNPKKPWMRVFFEKQFYFYCYNNKFFISETKLKSQTQERHTQAETSEFKRVYSFIKRYVVQNTRRHYPFYYLSEALWRRKKGFKQLNNELCELLGL